MDSHAQSSYDLFQWIAVAAILLTAVIVIIVKIVRFNKQLRSGNGAACSCGCEGCNAKCNCELFNKQQK